MELNSNPSNVKRIFQKRSSMIPSVFEEVINRYAGIKAQEQQLDPTQLQVGQSIYDETGEEYMVVENQNGTTTKVLMPVSQQGQPVPEVRTVEDADLTTSYKVQPPNNGTQMAETATKRGQSEDVDWDEIQSIMLDLNTFVRRKDMRGVTVSVEELTNVILSYMEFPEEGMKFPPMFARLIHAHTARKMSKKASFERGDGMAPNIAETLKKAKGSQRKNSNGILEVLPEFKNASRGQSIYTKQAKKYVLENDWNEFSAGTELLLKIVEENKAVFNDIPYSKVISIPVDKLRGVFSSEDTDEILQQYGSHWFGEDDPGGMEDNINLIKDGSKFKDILPEFKSVKSTLKRAQVPETSVFPDVTSFHDPIKVNTEFNSKFKEDDDEKDEINIGQTGFVDIMNSINDMVGHGYETVDVILNIGERFPRDQGQKVLEEARRQGVL